MSIRRADSRRAGPEEKNEGLAADDGDSPEPPSSVSNRSTEVKAPKYSTELNDVRIDKQDRANHLVDRSMGTELEVFVQTMDLFVTGDGKYSSNDDRIHNLRFSAVLDKIDNDEIEDAFQIMCILNKHNPSEYAKSDGAFRKQLRLLAELDIDESKKLTETRITSISQIADNLPIAGEDEPGGNSNPPLKLLERLGDTFTNCKQEGSQNALWEEDFGRALSMMGKQLDQGKVKRYFTEACKLQSSFDSKLLTYLNDEYESNTSRPGYEPRLRNYQDADKRFAQVDKRLTQYRARVEENDLAQQASCSIFMDIAPVADEEVSPKVPAEEATQKEKQQENLKPDEIPVIFPSNEIRRFGLQRNARLLKRAICYNTGIPEEHIRLSKVQSGVPDEHLEEHAVLQPGMVLRLHRPLMQAVWVQFFLDNLVLDVDEDLVMYHWQELCKHTRRNSAQKKGPAAEKYFIEQQLPLIKDKDPSQLFLYAPDLRKVMSGFGDQLSEEEVAQFIEECRPITTLELFESGRMGAEEYQKDENRLDFVRRIYHEGYYNALTDDTL